MFIITETYQVHHLHRKQPISEVVVEKINMAEMAATVVSNMMDRSRMVGPFTPSISPWKCDVVIVKLCR